MNLRVLSLLLLPMPAFGHETWLQPEKFVAAPDESVQVTLRISDGKSVRDANLKPDRILRVELVKEDRHMPLPLQSGDATVTAVAKEETVVKEKAEQQQ